ncbi:MAG: cupredoxin domain-containing protein [Thermoplasmatota archaeon]
MRPRNLLPLLVAAVVLAGCARPAPAPSSTTTPPPATVIVTTIVPGPVQTVTPPPEIVTVTVTPSPAETTTPPPSSTSTAPPGPPPVLTDVAATVLSPNRAVVRWTVGDVVPGVRSQALYGPGTGLGLATPTQVGNGTYPMLLTGLASCSAYSYKVVATSTDGGTNASEVGTFTTQDGPSLNASAITAGVIMHNSLNITWHVTGPTDAVSTVDYGPTTAYGYSLTAVGNGTVSTTITGLQSSKDYHLQLHVETPCHSFSRSDQLFHTATLVAVDIVGNNGPLSFAPAGSSAGPVSAPAGTPVVFSVHNKDTAAHDFSLKGQSYGSNLISPGQTVIVVPSITLAAGQYTIYSSQDNPGGTSPTGMSGTLNVQ